MEFTIVSAHDGLTLSANLKTMDVWSIPEAYLVYMGCENAEQYVTSIVHCTFDSMDHEDIIHLLKEKRYAPINGKVVFRHNKSMRTATVIFHAHSTLLPDDRILLIKKVSHIQWQDDDEIVRVLGMVSVKRSLNRILSKVVMRNDIKCVSVPLCDLKITEGGRKQLEFLKCEFGINVAYSSGGNTQTRRSAIIPSSLLISDLPDLSHHQYWAYADFMSPKPVFLDASARFLELVQLEHVGNGSLEEDCSHMFTAAYLQKVMTQIVPVLSKLQHGETFSEVLEFVTVNGKENLECTWYKTRNIVLGLVHYRGLN